MVGVRGRDKPMVSQDTRQAAMWARSELQVLERDIYDEGNENGKSDPPYSALRSRLWASSSDTGHSDTP